MAGKVGNIKGCSPLKLHYGLAGMYPRWRGSVTRANISIHIANNKVTYE